MSGSFTLVDGFTSRKKYIYTYKHLKTTKFSQSLGIQLRFVWRLKFVKRRISLTPSPSSDISPFIHFNLVTFHQTRVRTRFNSFLLFRDRIHHHSPSVVAVHIRAVRRRLCIIVRTNPLTVLLSEVHQASNLPEYARNAALYDECTVA